MGTRTAVLIRHDNFPELIANKDLGECLHYLNPLWMKKGQNKEPVPNPKGYHFLGETDSDKSLAVFYYKGMVWCPSIIKMGRKIKYPTFPTCNFSIIDISGDCSQILCGKRDVGLHLMDAVTSVTGHLPGQTVYVKPYGQAIAIVGTFSSEEVGISMLEGNCSWVVGKEPTPSWSRATNVRSLHWKEVQELTLALKVGVEVDLTSKKIQSLVLGYF